MYDCMNCKDMIYYIEELGKLRERNALEVDQFNEGFEMARAGKPESDQPNYEIDTDNWILGYAWGSFEPMKKQIAREKHISDELYLLLADNPETKLMADNEIAWLAKESTKNDTYVGDDDHAHDNRIL